MWLGLSLRSHWSIGNNTSAPAAPYLICANDHLWSIRHTRKQRRKA